MRNLNNRDQIKELNTDGTSRHAFINRDHKQSTAPAYATSRSKAADKQENPWQYEKQKIMETNKSCTGQEPTFEVGLAGAIIQGPPPL